MSENGMLYDACVGYMVSEKTGADSWAAVCAYVNSKWTVDKDLLRDEFKAVETRIKQEFGITVMPTAWRSAKTTALKAHANGVMVLCEGVAVPKTSLTRALCEPKAPSNPDALMHDYLGQPAWCDR